MSGAACVHTLTTSLQVTWTGPPKAEAGRQVYRAAQVGDAKVVLGSVVLLEAEETDRPQQEEAAAAAGGGGAARPKQQHEQYVFGLVQCMWEDEDGEQMAQVGR